jgi:hypothetical protein
MAYDYSKFSTLSNANDSSILEDAQEAFNEYFKYAPNKKTTGTIDGVVYPFVLQHKRYGNNKDNIDYIITEKETPLEIGSYVEYESTTWLVINKDKRTIDTHINGVSYECNDFIRWYDSDGVYREFPVYLNQKSVRIDEDNYMFLMDGTRECYVQLNEHTAKIFDGKEFLLDSVSKRNKYRVINQETLNNGNALLMTFERYQINTDVDNIELGIANYANRPIFNLTILNDDSEFVIGDTIQINYSILDKDNQQVSKDVVYDVGIQTILSELDSMNLEDMDLLTLGELGYTSTTEDVVSVDENGIVTALTYGIATIRVSMADNENVYDEFQLLVTATPLSNTYIDVNNSTAEIIKTLTETYTWNKYDNGVLLPSNFTFEIDPSSTASSNDYDFTIINGNSYSITCINEGKKLAVNILEDGGLSKQITYDLVGFW